MKFLRNLWVKCMTIWENFGVSENPIEVDPAAMAAIQMETSSHF